MRRIRATYTNVHDKLSQHGSTVPRIALNQRTVVAGAAEGEEEGEEAARIQNPRRS